MPQHLVEMKGECNHLIHQQEQYHQLRIRRMDMCGSEVDNVSVFVERKDPKRVLKGVHYHYNLDSPHSVLLKVKMMFVHFEQSAEESSDEQPRADTVY